MFQAKKIARSVLLVEAASLGLALSAQLPAQSSDNGSAKAQYPASDPTLPSLRGTSLGAATAAPARQPGEGVGPFRKLLSAVSR